VEHSIKHTQEHIERLDTEMKKLTDERTRTADHPRSKQRDKHLRDIASDQTKIEGKLNTARSELYRYEVAKKYIDLFFPRDSFQTLALVIGLVVIAVAIKGFFEFWQETLVGSVVNLSLFDLRNRFYRNAVHLDVTNFGEDGSHELMARFTNDMEMLG